MSKKSLKPCRIARSNLAPQCPRTLLSCKCFDFYIFYNFKNIGVLYVTHRPRRDFLPILRNLRIRTLAHHQVARIQAVLDDFP